MAKTTAAQFAKMSEVPAQVRELVASLCKEKRMRNISVNAATKVYIDEDARYNVYFNGAWRRFQAMGEWSGYASGGMASTTGQSMPLPVGAWVVESRIFLGKWGVSVYGAGLTAIGGAK